MNSTHRTARFGIPSAVKDALRRRRRLPALWYVGPLEQESCHHEWLYHERQPGEDYTGYCEHCSKCGELRQIAQ